MLIVMLIKVEIYISNLRNNASTFLNEMRKGIKLFKESLKSAFDHLVYFKLNVHGLCVMLWTLRTFNLVNLGLGKLSQADEYLAQAEWTVLKSTDATDGHKSKLYRNMGLLYAAKGDYENSLRTLAEDVRFMFSFVTF